MTTQPPFITLCELLQDEETTNEQLSEMFPNVPIHIVGTDTPPPAEESQTNRQPSKSFISSELVEDYRSFLLEAQKAHENKKVVLSTWELDFVESCKDRRVLSAKQAACIDKMIQKYNGCFDW